MGVRIGDDTEAGVHLRLGGPNQSTEEGSALISTDRIYPYTPDEALEALGNPVARNTWYRALNSGQVPSWRLGKKIFIAANVIREMLVAQGGADGQNRTPAR